MIGVLTISPRSGSCFIRPAGASLNKCTNKADPVDNIRVSLNEKGRYSSAHAVSDYITASPSNSI
jgi:hypothetical protein